MIKKTPAPYEKLKSGNLTVGSAFHDVTVNATYKQLVKAFGRPTNRGVDGKIEHEWVFSGPRGRIALYDWRCDGAKHGSYAWHVGAYDKTASVDFARWASQRLDETMGDET